MRYLISGVSGFVGSTLCDFLLEKEKDAIIYGIKRWRSRIENIKHLFNNGRVHFLEADLLDRTSLANAIKESKPDVVYHFAAQSFPGSSFKTPISTVTTNTVGSINFFEELLIARNNKICDPIIINCSTSEVFGMPQENEVPIKETNPIRAANPYSISKVAQDLFGTYCFQAHGLKVITTRLFSHEGKRRGKEFAISWFAYQIVNNERIYKDFYIKNVDNHKNKRFIVKVGNLDSVRTYAHIDDAIKAYYLIKSLGKIGKVYVIGGDHTCSVGDMLENLLSKSIIPRNLVDIIVDPQLVRPTDITLQIPCSDEFKKDTGWKPTLGIDEICEDILSYWREQL